MKTDQIGRVPLADLSGYIVTVGFEMYWVIYLWERP